MKGRGFMSLYGINAYTSNSYYSSLLSGKNGSSLMNSLMSSKKNTLSDMLTGALKTDQNDLYAIAKKAQLVRSRDYQKELIAGFKEYFYGTSDKTETEDTDNTAAADKTDEEKLAQENRENLVKNAKSLSEYAGVLANGQDFFGDPEKTLSAVKNFVNSYNSTLENLQKSDDANALQKGVPLVSTVNAYSRTLKRIGITTGSDNKLTLNEGKLKEASATTLNSLFTGNYSLANKIADKASYVSRAANLESQVSYNSKGNKTDFYNKLAASMFEGKV